MKEAADPLTRLESLPQAMRVRSLKSRDFTAFMAASRG
jgi:hypothetical protein